MSAKRNPDRGHHNERDCKEEFAALEQLPIISGPEQVCSGPVLSLLSRSSFCSMRNQIRPGAGIFGGAITVPFLYEELTSRASGPGRINLLVSVLALHLSTGNRKIGP